MPQMAPMNWLVLTCFTWFPLIVMMGSLYFFPSWEMSIGIKSKSSDSADWPWL